VSGAQRLINKDNVAVILGPAGSGCALAVRQVANPAKVVMVTPAINDTIIGPDMPFIFRSACNWSDQVYGLVDSTANRYKKFAILHDTTGLGEGGATEFRKALAKRGITPVAEEKYEVNTLNLMPQVTRIKNAGAEFIFLCAVGADVITVGKLMKQIGFDVPVGGNNGLGMRVTLKAADKLEGWVFTDTVDGNKPQFKEFLKTFVARYKTTPTYHPAAQGYDAIYAIVKGLERTSGNGGEALVQAFRQGISIDGATCKTGTSFHWDKERSVAIDATQLSLWKIHNGDYEMVK
jgi:branched-chain amino acid transport system substrate-binding protein